MSKTIIKNNEAVSVMAGPEGMSVQKERSKPRKAARIPNKTAKMWWYAKVRDITWAVATGMTRATTESNVPATCTKEAIAKETTMICTVFKILVLTPCAAATLASKDVSASLRAYIIKNNPDVMVIILIVKTSFHDTPKTLPNKILVIFIALLLNMLRNAIPEAIKTLETIAMATSIPVLAKRVRKETRTAASKAAANDATKPETPVKAAAATPASNDWLIPCPRYTCPCALTLTPAKAPRSITKQAASIALGKKS